MQLPRGHLVRMGSCSSRDGGVRKGSAIFFYTTYAFTEHGAIQAANVVNSSHAIAMGIYVVRAFVQLRGVAAANKELAQELTELERRVDSHDVSALTAI